tara:strand:- start:5363 stop:5686 length:324 start_codon:yes stop_codon:yes gene_type:complete
MDAAAAAGLSSGRTTTDKVDRERPMVLGQLGICAERANDLCNQTERLFGQARSIADKLYGEDEAASASYGVDADIPSGDLAVLHEQHNRLERLLVKLSEQITRLSDL